MNQKLNIAEACKARYESEDFKNDHAFYLFGDRDAVQNRIRKFMNECDFEKKYGFGIFLDHRKQDSMIVERIYDYILENIEDFTREYSGYYVGYTSLSAVEYGEQEEQLEGLEEYGTMKELRKMFEDADYYVSDDNYAYYNIDGGVHVDLLAGDLTELFAELCLIEIAD